MIAVEAGNPSPLSCYGGWKCQASTLYSHPPLLLHAFFNNSIAVGGINMHAIAMIFPRTKAYLKKASLSVGVKFNAPPDRMPPISARPDATWKEKQ